MQPRTFVIVVSVLVAVGALILLGSNVSATTASGSTVACGSGFSTDMSQAAHDSRVDQLAGALRGDADYVDRTAGYALQCTSALSTRRGWGFGLLALGAVSLFAGLVIRRPSAAPTAGSTP